MPFEGAQPGAPPALSAHTLGKYRLIAKLARGARSTVYVAAQQGPSGVERLVAVKELRHQHSDDPAPVSRFLSEARLAARLHHPNIVETLEVGSSGGRHFRAMEYLEGPSLERLVHRADERGTPVPLGMHLAFHLDLLAALDHAHRLADVDGRLLGLVHGDIAPQHVVVTYEGQIKLVGFGGAASSRSSCSDLQSVGAMLWEAIVGRRPSGRAEGGSDAALLEGPQPGAVERLRHVRPDVDPELAAVVERAMNLVPGAGYASALAMRDDLERYMLARSMAPLHTRALTALVMRLFADDRERVREIIDLSLRAVDGDRRPTPSSMRPTEMGMSVTVPEEEADDARPPQAKEVSSAEDVPSGDRARAEDDDAAPSGDVVAGPKSDVRPPSKVRPAAPRVDRVYEAPPSTVRLRPVIDRLGERAPPTLAPSRLLSPRRSRGWLGLSATLVGLVVAFAAFAVGRSSEVGPSAVSEVPAPPAVLSPSPPTPARLAPTAHVVVRASPASARIYLDDGAVDNPYVADHVRDGTSHGLRVEAPGYETKTSILNFATDVDVAIDLGLAEPATLPASRARASTAVAASPPSAAVRAATVEARPGPKPIDTGNPYAP